MKVCMSVSTAVSIAIVRIENRILRDATCESITPAMPAKKYHVELTSEQRRARILLKGDEGPDGGPGPTK